MGKATIIIAVVAVVALAGAGVGIFVLNNQDKTPTLTVLVEDQDGVYFWTEGKGETAADALAKTSAGVKVTMLDGSWGKYISEVNGLKEDYTTDTCYWGLYYLDGDKWTYSDVGVSELKVSEHSTIGLFYVVSDSTTYEIKAGGPDKVTVPKVEDKRVWGGSTSGTVFAITSHTGMYFYINGDKSGTMAERFKAATEDYKIPYVEKLKDGKPNGIDKIFGEGTVKVDEDYKYWVTYVLDNDAWIIAPKKLPNIEDANDYKQMAMVYGISSMSTGVDTPLPPIYKAS